MLILDRADVEALLDLDALIDGVGVAMSDLSAGRVSVPARVFAAKDNATGLLDMPTFLPSVPALMSKLTTVFPGNAGTPLPVRQAVIVAFDPETGTPAALMDGTYITAAKTAACSALSVRLLARQDASRLAILGTGAQARAHALIVARARPFRDIRIAGRDPAKTRALAADLSRELDCEVVPAESYEQALQESTSPARPPTQPSRSSAAPGSLPGCTSPQSDTTPKAAKLTTRPSLRCCCSSNHATPLSLPSPPTVISPIRSSEA